MRMRSVILVAALSLFTLNAFAQTNDTVQLSVDEFARANGGAVSMITKSPSHLSGTLSLGQSFGDFGGRRYEGSAGGTIVNDRVWFFAAASVLPEARFSPTTPRALDAKVNAQPVAWSDVSASYSRAQVPVLTQAQTNFGTVPSSWLSLHSTSVINDHMMMEMSFSRRSGVPTTFGLR